MIILTVFRSSAYVRQGIQIDPFEALGDVRIVKCRNGIKISEDRTIVAGPGSFTWCT